MSKEIEKFFVKRLSAILTDYVKDFSQNNVAKVEIPNICNNRIFKKTIHSVEMKFLITALRFWNIERKKSSYET